MSHIESYRDLEGWREAMNLVEFCYRVTESFPRAEKFELARQFRRSAMSIPSNVAEGHGRRSTGAYVNHLGISLGSQAELETQIELSRRLGFLTSAEAREIKGPHCTDRAPAAGSDPCPRSQEFLVPSS